VGFYAEAGFKQQKWRFKQLDTAGVDLDISWDISARYDVRCGCSSAKPRVSKEQNHRTTERPPI
jgi:hypothetical protein